LAGAVRKARGCFKARRNQPEVIFGLYRHGSSIQSQCPSLFIGTGRTFELMRLLARGINGISWLILKAGEIELDLFCHASMLGLEGLVSKPRPSLPGRLSPVG
jgi:hypothetical protein